MEACNYYVLPSLYHPSKTMGRILYINPWTTYTWEIKQLWKIPLISTQKKIIIIIMNRKASKMDGLGMTIQYVLIILNINARTYMWLSLNITFIMNSIQYMLESFNSNTYSQLKKSNMTTNDVKKNLKLY